MMSADSSCSFYLKCRKTCLGIWGKPLVLCSFHAYASLIERDLLPKYHGFPHWAKIEVERMGPEAAQHLARQKFPVAKLNAARDMLDPKNILSNPIIDAVLPRSPWWWQSWSCMSLILKMSQGPLRGTLCTPLTVLLCRSPQHMTSLLLQSDCCYLMVSAEQLCFNKQLKLSMRCLNRAYEWPAREGLVLMALHVHWACA